MIAVLSGTGAAQTYLPLAPGTRWIYAFPNGVDRDTVTVVGPTTFDGVDVVEFRYQGFNNGLLNYWTVASDGAVQLHGFDRPAESLGVHHIPPIRMVQPPVMVGQTWRDVVTSHCTRAPACDETPVPYVSTIRIISSRTIPAGTFTAAAVERDLDFFQARNAVQRSEYSILGTKLSGGGERLGGAGPTYWWVENVGLIDDSTGWSLLTFDQTTAVRTSSWGRVKLLYR